jgi:hypothetical protein
MNLDKVGDVKLGTGDLPGAPAAYRDALDVRRELAEPPQARAALTEALAIFEKLEQQQKLTAGRKNWPGPHYRSWREIAVGHCPTRRIVC